MPSGKSPRVKAMGKFEPILQTDRLLLVNFTEAHLDDFAGMNGDAEVMEFFPATQSRDESAAFLARIMAHRAARGTVMVSAARGSSPPGAVRPQEACPARSSGPGCARDRS